MDATAKNYFASSVKNNCFTLPGTTSLKIDKHQNIDKEKKNLYTFLSILLKTGNTSEIEKKIVTILFNRILYYE